MTSDLLLHSVSYAGLWGQAFPTVDDFVNKAADLGYNGDRLTMLIKFEFHFRLIKCDCTIIESFLAELSTQLMQRISMMPFHSIYFQTGTLRWVSTLLTSHTMYAKEM